MKIFLYVVLFLCLSGCFVVLSPILLSSSDIIAILLGLTLFFCLVGLIIYQLWEKFNV